MIGENPSLSQSSMMKDLFILLEEKKASDRLYIHNEEGFLIGHIQLEDVLEFIAPYTLFMDDDLRERWMKHLETVPLSAFIRDDAPASPSQGNLSDLMISLLSSCDTMPVITDDNQAPEEVSYAQLINILSHQQTEKYYAVS